jgi:hypothetical protein
MEPRRLFDHGSAPPPDQRRPDFEAFLGDRGYTFDLCITYSLAPTYRRADGSSRSLALLEQSKVEKFSALSAASQLTFIPLVMDVFGGLGAGFSTFLRLVAGHLPSKYSSKLLSHFYQEFGVHLQRSNARWISAAVRSDRSHRFRLLSVG